MYVFVCVQTFVTFFRVVARQLGMNVRVPLGGTRVNSGHVAVRTLQHSKGCADSLNLTLDNHARRLHALDAQHTRRTRAISLC
jgi:hypothetical protein